MNTIMERRVRTGIREPLDRSLIWNQRHLLHGLHAYDTFYNTHRAHQGIAKHQATSTTPQTDPDSSRPTHLNIRRRDRPGSLVSAENAIHVL
jgi:hypothetical protein